MICCPTRATLPKVQIMTTALTSTHGSQASTASLLLGLPPPPGTLAGTGIPSSPMSGAFILSTTLGTLDVGGTLEDPGVAKISSLEARVPTAAAPGAAAKFALYCSISRGFHTWTKAMTQISEMSAARTSGNSGPNTLETVNCVTAHVTPATSATGHAVRRLRKPVNKA